MQWNNSKEQSSSWEANSHSAGQDIPHLCGTRRFITVEPATGPYPEKDASSQHLTTPFH